MIRSLVFSLALLFFLCQAASSFNNVPRVHSVSTGLDPLSSDGRVKLLAKRLDVDVGAPTIKVHETEGQQKVEQTEEQPKTSPTPVTSPTSTYHSASSTAPSDSTPGKAKEPSQAPEVSPSPSPTTSASTPGPAPKHVETGTVSEPTHMTAPEGPVSTDPKVSSTKTDDKTSPDTSPKSNATQGTSPTGSATSTETPETKNDNQAGKSSESSTSSTPGAEKSPVQNTKADENKQNSGKNGNIKDGSESSSHVDAGKSEPVSREQPVKETRTDSQESVQKSPKDSVPDPKGITSGEIRQIQAALKANNIDQTEAQIREILDDPQGPADGLTSFKNSLNAADQVKMNSLMPSIENLLKGKLSAGKTATHDNVVKSATPVTVPNTVSQSPPAPNIQETVSQNASSYKNVTHNKARLNSGAVRHSFGGATVLVSLFLGSIGLICAVTL